MRRSTAATNLIARTALDGNAEIEVTVDRLVQCCSDDLIDGGERYKSRGLDTWLIFFIRVS